MDILRWTEARFVDDLRLRLVASDSGLRVVEFVPFHPLEGEQRDTDPVLRESVAQLRAYFTRKLRHFDLPLDLQGTPFQLRVWKALVKIPYGETRSYSQIAVAVNSPNAVRAVGAANGANPVAIIVPCHRVIGSDGKLTGYGGGLPLKKKLLELEGAHALPLAL